MSAIILTSLCLIAYVFASGTALHSFGNWYIRHLGADATLNDVRAIKTGVTLTGVFGAVIVALYTAHLVG